MFDVETNKRHVILKSLTNSLTAFQQYINPSPTLLIRCVQVSQFIDQFLRQACNAKQDEPTQLDDGKINTLYISDLQVNRKQLDAFLDQNFLIIFFEDVCEYACYFIVHNLYDFRVVLVHMGKDGVVDGNGSQSNILVFPIIVF